MVSFHSDSCLYFGLRFWGRSSQDIGARVRCTRERLEATTYSNVCSKQDWSVSIMSNMMMVKANKNIYFPLIVAKNKSSSRESIQ